MGWVNALDSELQCLAANVVLQAETEGLIMWLDKQWQQQRWRGNLPAEFAVAAACGGGGGRKSYAGADSALSESTETPKRDLNDKMADKHARNILHYQKYLSRDG